MPRPGSITLPESTSAFIPVRQQREERLVMGRDIRHQVLRVALSVKVNGKRRRLSLHSRPGPFARATLHMRVKLSVKITETASRVGATPIP